MEKEGNVEKILAFADALRHIAWVLAEPHAVVLFASPEEPDEDSCASMFAFREYLRRAEKVLRGRYRPEEPLAEYHLYAPEKPRQNTLFERIKPLGDPMTEIETRLPGAIPDIIISFDYGQYSRTHLPPDAGTLHIGFDHHPAKEGDTGFPENGIEIRDPSSPSCTAILYDFFKYAGFSISPEMADCLLVGLLADTGKFTNALTSPGALETGAALIRAGADYQKTIEAMRIEISAEAFFAQLKARDNIIVDAEAGIGFLSFSQANLKAWGAAESDVLPLFGVIQNISEVRLAARYSEREDGLWYCSLRSTPKKGVRVDRIAEKFGGGGHDYAAAFVSHETPREIFQKLRSSILT